MFSTLRSIYQQEMYAPGPIGIFINPFYFIRRALYRGVIARKARLQGKLLDFGCGRKPYKPSFEGQECIGLDIEESGPRRRGPAAQPELPSQHVVVARKP